MTIDVAANNELTEIEIKILDQIMNNPQISAFNISLIIGKSKRTAERYIKSLQEKGYIIRDGSNKKGNWKVIK